MCRQTAGCNAGTAGARGHGSYAGEAYGAGLGGSLGQCQGQTATGLGGSLGQCEGHGRDKAGSTPPVVPGAAPALAKAGVGGL